MTRFLFSLVTLSVMAVSGLAQAKSYYQVYEVKGTDKILAIQTIMDDKTPEAKYRVFEGKPTEWKELTVKESILGFSNTILYVEGEGSIDLPSPTNMGQKPTWNRGRATQELEYKEVSDEEINGWGLPL